MRHLVLAVSAFFLVGGIAIAVLQHQKKEGPQESYAGEPFRASIITDIDHCPSRVPADLTKLDLFLSEAQAKKVDFIASLGDNASHRLSDCSATGDADARFIADFLRKTDIPTYFILGDHDIASAVSSYEAWLMTAGRKELYYSFDVKDVHVIVLDTVLGGEPLSPPCEEKEDCHSWQIRKNDLASLEFSLYREKYPDSLREEAAEKKKVRSALEAAEDQIALTRSSGKRDIGRIGEAQLKFLERDLKQTHQPKILVLSDHPLFPFTSPRKTYDIKSGAQVRELLERKQKDGADIVAVSGEAHLWHEEARNGIRYYIVDEFRNTGGSWADISWPNEGFRFEKITH